MNSSKMILSLAGMKIIVGIDGYIAAWYLKFVVNLSEDGSVLL